jgi:ABC-type transport system involved in cytochrome bd biosynthesis fused ATPase/permease subunit
VADGRTDPVLLAAAALGVLGSFEAVGGLGAAWTAADGVRAAAGRVAALGAARPAVADPPAPAPVRGSALELVDVTLAYPDSTRPALEGFSLHLRPGEKVALTGPSGAGKSSVLALALRARDPDAGRVALGGTDVRDLALADVRAATAWAPQSPQVLGGGLAGNLRLARQDATDAELEEALRDVELDDVLAAVGLDGWIGEGGQRLSAGERSRLALARALLSPAPVLLLDEPTAHLDGPLAARVLDRLARDERSVLLVTHTTTGLDGRWRVVTVDTPG